VVDLKGKSPFDGSLWCEVDGAVLSEVTYSRVTSIMPFSGRKAAVSAALKTGGGTALPAVGRVSGPAGRRVIWVGRGQYLMVGAAVDPAIGALAALCDQTSAWVAMRLEGPRAQAVLARLCPVDLRVNVFKRGHVARCELGHMPVILWRRPKGFEIMVMRSFAQTAAARLVGTMTSVAASGCES
jgi:sarcosine oxidase subunit gamma